MFTECVSNEQAAIFSRLLGVRLLSSDVLETDTDREAYFADARSCAHHLFLDPDTGLRLKVSAGKDRPSYLFGPEVVSIVRERPKSLTLVFDKSLARGRESEQLQVKLDYLYERGIASAAYVSHACFILMATNEELIGKALGMIERESGLPTTRFLVNSPHSRSMQPVADTAGSG
jgi:hypothetical protein